jgi:hypothetical protein
MSSPFERLRSSPIRTNSLVRAELDNVLRTAVLAFLSRYEETGEERDAQETYRLVVTTEENFLHFVKAWAHEVRS